MADHIMTDGEAKEYVRLLGIYSALISTAAGGRSLAADFQRTGAALRVHGVQRPRDEGNERIGWDAADKLIGPPGNDYPDSELVERAARSAVGRHPKSKPPWSALTKAFACGNDTALALCRRFGIDPDGDAQ